MVKMGSPPHSKKNFSHRIKSLINSRIIHQVGDAFTLTDMGKWVANSTILGPDERIAFIDAWVCGACVHKDQIAISTPLLQTIKKTSSGIRLDVVCPNCGQSSKYVPTPKRMDIISFVKFYTDIVDELGQYVQLSAAKIK
jgi:hypothetical protein